MSERDNLLGQDSVEGRLVMSAVVEEALIAHGLLRVECVRDGRVIWVDEGPNLIVTTGRNKLLDETLSGSSYTAAWYIGLINDAAFSAIAAGDTMASHAGWAETSGYTAGTRPAASFSAAASGSKQTSSAVSFSINTTVTVNGIFLADNSTKGGSTGVLFAAKSFTSPRACQNGDTLNVTYTASLTAS